MKRNDNKGGTGVFASIATNKGCVRARNEDNFFADRLGTRGPEDLCGHRVISGSDRYVFAVCDGMGGEQFGDAASATAVETLGEFADKLRKVPLERLHETVNEFSAEANDRICKMVLERNANLSGSTLVMVVIDGEKAYPFSIGDSRIYYVSSGTITQVSEDQTLAMKKLKANIYTEEEARSSSDSHKITRFLGVDSRHVGLTALAYPPLDISHGAVLLCSDGLTDMCSDEEILSVITHRNDPFVSQHLVEAALRNGGYDNITCIMLNSEF